jgi:hypothetical protein
VIKGGIASKKLRATQTCRAEFDKMYINVMVMFGFLKVLKNQPQIAGAFVAALLQLLFLPKHAGTDRSVWNLNPNVYSDQEKKLSVQ